MKCRKDPINRCSQKIFCSSYSTNNNFGNVGSRYEEIDFKHIVDLAFNGIWDLSFNLERTLI